MRATRRDVLGTVTVAAGTALAFGPEWEAAAQVPTAGIFPQGVASGDPKPRSVILWTRAFDPRRAGLDLPLRLQVATAASFAGGTVLVDALVTARRRNDGCIRVKVTGLRPHRHYWFRFGQGSAWSRVGWTRTAPLPDDATPVRFAYASCQDYIGRYYNAYLPLLAPEQDGLDFLVHLGDFIYETTGDPAFQNSGGARTIRFADEAGAIPLGDPADPFFAAASLANYRQLHQTYRSDELLQEVLAKFPLVAIWDDHEFSDDGWQDNANYFDGRNPASDNDATARKRNAERAWLEHMPIDDAADGGSVREILDTGPDRLFPRTRIWRNLRYGKTINLTLSDYRSYRPDHLIAEDAFPGRVVASQRQLAAKYAELAAEDLAVDFAADLPRFEPYVAWNTLDAGRQAALQAAFAREYQEAGYQGADGPAARARRSLQGLLSITYLNARLGPTQQIVSVSAPRGLTYQMIGKRDLFAAFGARYALDQGWFVLVRALQQHRTRGRLPGPAAGLPARPAARLGRELERLLQLGLAHRDGGRPRGEHRDAADRPGLAELPARAGASAGAAADPAQRRPVGRLPEPPRAAARRLPPARQRGDDRGRHPFELGDRPHQRGRAAVRVHRHRDLVRDLLGPGRRRPARRRVRRRAGPVQGAGAAAGLHRRAGAGHQPVPDRAAAGNAVPARPRAGAALRRHRQERRGDRRGGRDQLPADLLAAAVGPGRRELLRRP